MSKAELSLKSLYKSLSASGKNLADFILANAERVPFLSVYEIAKAGKVSVATVSRLVRKLGYRTLKHFKVEMAKDSSAAPDYFYQQISAEDTEGELIEKVFRGNIKSLEDTLRLLSREELIAAVKRIAQARSLTFFGIGSSGFICRDAAMRFSLLGFPAQVFTDPNEIFFRATLAGREDVVAGVSHSGRTAITVKALELAQANRATTIGISNYLQSPLHGASSFFFCTSFPESQVKVTALSSRIAQLCIIDALYLLSTRFKKNLLDYERINARMESLLRLPERG